MSNIESALFNLYVLISHLLSGYVFANHNLSALIFDQNRPKMQFFIQGGGAPTYGSPPNKKSCMKPCWEHGEQKERWE